jgi:putative tricarboxylic transport membrane protein
MLADRVIFVCTVLLAVVYLASTTQVPSLEIGDPLGPRAFPYLLGIALLVAAGIFGIEIWKESRQRKAETEAPPFDRRVIPVLALVVLWTGVYYLMFEPLGYVISTSVFLIPLMARFNPGKWIANILSAVLFSAGTFFLFAKLEVSLPKGILPF